MNRFRLPISYFLNAYKFLAHFGFDLTGYRRPLPQMVQKFRFIHFFSNSRYLAWQQHLRTCPFEIFRKFPLRQRDTCLNAIVPIAFDRKLQSCFHP